MDLYRDITACRICGSADLPEVMAFGEQYLASAFVKSNEGHPMAKVKVPLTVVLCGGCGTVQLKEDVQREALFSDYFYRSATNPMMQAALRDIVEDVQRNIELADGDVVLDVGCNDATMLMMYPERLTRVGVDPASNIDWSHVGDRAALINDFFSRDAVLEKTGGRDAKVITTIAMLYNMDGLDDVVRDISTMLAEDGLWCIQLSYLPSLLDTMSFYDVCHEHLYYFSLETLEHLLGRHGLKVFDASTNDVNGGSLRVMVAHEAAARTETEALGAIRAREAERKLRDPGTYQAFFDEVVRMKDVVTAYLKARKADGDLVVGLGASTKGNVLLQFFDIDKALLPYISERNPDKCGLRTLGTDIGLVSEEEARDMKPSDMLVLIWFFKDELLKRERGYLEAGGRLLFPMPHPHVVTKDGTTDL